MAEEIRLIVFLGNKGPQYSRTRHNAGWLLAEEISVLRQAAWQSKFSGRFCRERFADRQIVFLKPETFMNNSGRSVQEAAGFFRLQPAEILVVHDDLELNFGQVSFKFSGGLAGHNGLRSISGVLGTRDFARFRIGIGRPDHGNITPYVLGAFSDSEQHQLPQLLSEAAAVMEKGVEMGLNAAVETYFKTKLIESDSQ
ncbi:aminoacyl-tRNA hydrolase [bacterium]|nr:aminoacyl-tRNA hydrolase [bacterium]